MLLNSGIKEVISTCSPVRDSMVLFINDASETDKVGRNRAKNKPKAIFSFSKLVKFCFCMYQKTSTRAGNENKKIKLLSERIFWK